MNIPLRQLSLRVRAGHRLALSVVFLASLTIGVAPAGAVIVGSYGIQQRTQPTVLASPLQYHGGRVLHSTDTYAIYWDPEGAYRGDWAQLIDRYLHDVGVDSKGLSNVFAVDTQYADGSGNAKYQNTFRGAFTDTDPYPTVANGGKCTEPAVFACLTDRQIQAELQRYISSVNPPLPGATGTPVYYILTPPGVTVCTDQGGNGNCSNSTAVGSNPPNGICGYHSAITSVYSNVVYAVQPWTAGSSGEIIESSNPVKTNKPTSDVLACQDDGQLQEPNQLPGLNPFGNYAEGLADVIINDLSIEQSNIVADPYPAVGEAAWYQTGSNAEEGDVCRYDFGPQPPPPTPPTTTNADSQSNQTINGSSYYLQYEFDSAAETVIWPGIPCLGGVNLEPHFTAPNPVNAGDYVTFNGSESDVDINAKGTPANHLSSPVYAWNFGDPYVPAAQNVAVGASQLHAYTYRGTYTVTLTVTDGGQNTRSYSQAITVEGPPPPSSEPSKEGTPGVATPASPSTPGSTGSAQPGATTPGTTAPASAPKPLAAATVASTSLAKVLRNGLVIRYSVNEQVTGRFEVLLDAGIARRLGIHGPRAAGLPASSPTSIVIAKAILVTTKGGRNTVKILFGKHTAAQLHKLRKVSLTLRMIVRNASSRNPTTVLSKVTLHG